MIGRATAAGLGREAAKTLLSHSRALLGVVEEVAARKLQEKEMEVEWVVQRSVELEDHLAHLRTAFGEVLDTSMVMMGEGFAGEEGGIREGGVDEVGVVSDEGEGGEAADGMFSITIEHDRWEALYHPGHHLQQAATVRVAVAMGGNNNDDGIRDERRL